MVEKIFRFLKYHYGAVFLVGFGFFLVFYKWAGSFLGDEATYGQIAKESLANHSFLVLSWKGQLWFEKPPLMIWLTSFAFRIFGISETSAHIFPGISGVVSALALYLLGYNLFKDRMAAFFSGFIFLAVPTTLLYSRANMMDVPAGAFIAIGSLAVWKIIHEKYEWWIVLGISSGLAVMTKSVIGLTPFVLFIFLVLLQKNRKSLRSRHLKSALVVFILLVIPWHFFMTVKFGYPFWRDYFGYHIWNRFFEPILPFPWEGNSKLSYFKLIIGRSGAWIWPFAAASSGVVLLFFVQLMGVISSGGKRSTEKLDRYLSGNDFWLWLKKNEKAWTFLSFWFLIVFLPFFFSSTKLPNYMVLSFYPFSLLAGGFLSFIFQGSRWRMLLLTDLIFLFNFLPGARFRASDFGEAHFLIPKILIRLLGIGDRALLYVMSFLLIISCIIFLKYRKRMETVKVYSFLVLVGMGALVPFNPDRNPFLKSLGQDISRYAQGNQANLLYVIRPDHFSFHCVGAFYLPVGSKIEDASEKIIRVVPRQDHNYSDLCFAERGLSTREMEDQAIFSYGEGVVFKCEPE